MTERKYQPCSIFAFLFVQYKKLTIHSSKTFLLPIRYLHSEFFLMNDTNESDVTVVAFEIRSPDYRYVYIEVDGFNPSH